MSTQQSVCQSAPLEFGTIRASFLHPSLGGSPVLTITDQEAPDEPEVCLSIYEARALREWLNAALPDEHAGEPK
jgi:hypothetical protein